jgi:hypothetical protein
MTPSDTMIDDMRAMAKVVGIDIPAAYEHEVAANLERMIDLTKPLMAFELDPHVEQAPVFTP